MRSDRHLRARARRALHGNLTRDDLQFDSPYNTYRYAGLPPGPIAAPGRASLEAAAHPADVPYLYFVSRNDGSHVFAATLDEHNRNVFEYQIKPFRTPKLRGGDCVDRCARFAPHGRSRVCAIVVSCALLALTRRGAAADGRVAGSVRDASGAAVAEATSCC